MSINYTKFLLIKVLISTMSIKMISKKLPSFERMGEKGRIFKDYLESFTFAAIVIAVPYFPPALLIVGTLSPSLFVVFIPTVSYSPESNNHSAN